MSKNVSKTSKTSIINDKLLIGKMYEQLNQQSNYSHITKNDLFKYYY